MNARLIALAAGATLVGSALVAGCFSERVSGAGTACVAPADSTAGGSPIIHIVDFEFRPVSACVTAGTTVTWRNDGAQTHSSKADLGAWDSPLLNTGQSFTTTLAQAGRVTYYCAVHPFMQASIEVR